MQGWGVCTVCFMRIRQEGAAQPTYWQCTSHAALKMCPALGGWRCGGVQCTACVMRAQQGGGCAQHTYLQCTSNTAGDVMFHSDQGCWARYLPQQHSQPGAPERVHAVQGCTDQRQRQRPCAYEPAKWMSLEEARP